MAWISYTPRSENDKVSKLLLFAFTNEFRSVYIILGERYKRSTYLPK